jgi:hypothetical protein
MKFQVAVGVFVKPDERVGIDLNINTGNHIITVNLPIFGEYGLGLNFGKSQEQNATKKDA